MRAVACLLLASAALGGFVDPARARSTARASVPVVALAPFSVPDGLEDPEPVRTAFEALVSRQLEAAGFEVLPPARTGEVWESHRRATGPFFDPITGEELRDRTRAARRGALRDLAENHSVVAWIRPAIAEVAAPYERGRASWDGATEGAAPTGMGEVPGASVVLVLEDLAGETVAVGRGGIQLLAKYSLWNSKYGPVPRDKLFRDEKKNAAAVNRASEPVIAALRESRGARTPPEPEPLVPLAEPVSAEPAWPATSPGARIALLSALRVAGDVDVTPPARERYVELLGSRLRDAGWTVLEPGVFEAAFREAAVGAGGIHDPWTGRAIPGRLDTALHRARRRAAERLPGAILLHPVLTVVLAPFRNEKATWHGVTEAVADLSVLTRVLVTSSGRTEALSLRVSIEDLDGRELHRGFGGIQLTEKIERGRFVPVPREKLLRDPALDARAVDLALTGFLKPRSP